MMSEELNLLPCPNPECGSTDVHCGNEILMGITVVAFCKKCHMRGPEVFITDEAEIPMANMQAATAWNAIPRALTWTTEPPKAEGWYWSVGKDNSNNTEIVEIVTYSGTLHALVTGNPFVHPLLEFRFWSDCPIPMPKEPTP